MASRTKAQKRVQGTIEKMTTEECIQRIETLDARLGKGVGATRERNRLASRIVELDNARHEKV